jgi:hypothetical protein
MACPCKVVINTRSKINKGKIEIVETFEQCQKCKIFGFCFKYKEKGKE